MQERREALSAFKEGDVRFLICTDVAARGIDIKELPYVINMCLPDMPEAYIHRVGRVGRADTMGLAISIVSKVPERVWYCTKKGYKPWLEPNNKNTKLNSEGGHTRWYDESLILKEIETKYLSKKKVKVLNLNDIQGSLGLGPKGLKYGEPVQDGGASAEVVKRVAKLKPQVEALAELEVLAQQTFLRQTTF
jgi:ATP-dependent RNA helicase DDX1